MRLLSAVAVSLFLLATNAGAATYYVATTGNDAAAGSLTAPFRTIKQASRVVRPGDVVNVRGGVYYETTHVWQVKGTAAAPITFRAMQGEQVVLDGSKLAAGTAIMNFNQCEYIDFRGFEVRNSPYIGVNIWHGRHIRVLDNHIHHIFKNAIYSGGDTMAASSDITVSGNDVHDSALENQNYIFVSGGWPGAVVISRTERATIERNRIYRNFGEGLISVTSNYATIRNNELFDNFSSCVYLDNARFVTVDRNLIYSTGDLRFFRDGKPGVGMGVANEYKDLPNPSTDNVFTNNIVIGTRWGFYYGGFEAGGGLRNTKVLHNTFYGTATAAIVHVDTDAHANSVIANNIFYQTGIFAPTYAGGGAVTWRNNLWHGGSSGAAAGAGDLQGDPLFVNAGGFTAADYKLRHLSPAIHRASDGDQLATDYFGSARTAAADIGAHEESLSLGSSATAALPALLAPSAVAARIAGNAAVQVTWAKVNGAARYDVYRNGQFFDTVETNVLTDRSVAPATTYVYEVATRDAQGIESPRSAQAAVTTPGAAAAAKPEAPQGAHAVASSARVTLSWPAVTGATAYVLFRDGAPLSETASTTFADENVSAATTYAYTIVAVANGTQSAASEKIVVTTPAASRRRAVR